MYAIALIHHRRPLDEVLAAVHEHRTYLRDLQACGVEALDHP